MTTDTRPTKHTMSIKDKAAEALDLAHDFAIKVSFQRLSFTAACIAEEMLREYAALLQTQAVEADVVRVCPTRDIECGSNPASWCKSCPKRPADEPALPLTGLGCGCPSKGAE